MFTTSNDWIHLAPQKIIFMHGLKNAISAFLKNCQNGTFLPSELKITFKSKCCCSSAFSTFPLFYPPPLPPTSAHVINELSHISSSWGKFMIKVKKYHEIKNVFLNYLQVNMLLFFCLFHLLFLLVNHRLQLVFIVFHQNSTFLFKSFLLLFFAQLIFERQILEKIRISIQMWKIFNPWGFINDRKFSKATLKDFCHTIVFEMGQIKK